MAKRHISVINDRVEKALAESDNASRLIEQAILLYLDTQEKGYATTGYVEEIATECRREITICNQNYLQMKILFDDLVKEVFKDRR